MRTRPTPWVGLLTGVDREPAGLFPPGWDLLPAKPYSNPPRRRVTPRRGFGRKAIGTPDDPAWWLKATRRILTGCGWRVGGLPWQADINLSYLTTRRVFHRRAGLPQPEPPDQLMNDTNP